MDSENKEILTVWIISLAGNYYKVLTE